MKRPAIFVLSLLAGCAAPGSFEGPDVGEVTSGLKVCAGANTVPGIDVSHYDGTIDWKSVKGGGIDFAFIKATENVNFIDPMFATNWPAARAAGVLRGAYHFFRPEVDPVAQAKYFVANSGPSEPGDLPPVLDLEVTDSVAVATVAANARTFLGEVATLTGRTPIIYTSSNFFTTTLGGPAGFDGYPLWDADWQVTCPNIPDPAWTNWTFWQYTDTATIPGISGAASVDENQFNGTLAQLQQFAAGTVGPVDAGVAPVVDMALAATPDLSTAPILQDLAMATAHSDMAATHTADMTDMAKAGATDLANAGSPNTSNSKCSCELGGRPGGPPIGQCAIFLLVIALLDLRRAKRQHAAMRNSAHLVLGAIVLASLGGCVAAPADGGSVGAISQAIGEPQNGFPTADERLGLMAINRARADPTTVKGPQSTIYPPRPPVLWNYDLSRSSRFHATNLQTSDVSLMHTSPCTLNTNVGTSGCDGTTACACKTGAVAAACAKCANVAAENSCGTDPFVRIAYFSSIATGEVAAAGYSDVWATVLGWVDEPAGSDGHRMNLLDQGITSNTMGFGHTAGAGCWSSFDVSDSGDQNGLAIPTIPTAAVNPAEPSAGSARFYATWADPVSGAPTAFNAVVDGQCHSLTKELGSPTLNSDWYVDVTLAAGCHTWWILGTDGKGARQTYPTTGALYLSVGGATCTSDYEAQAPAASCEGNVTPPADMSMVVVNPTVDMASGQGNQGGSKDMAIAVTRDFGAGAKGAAVGAVCHAHSDCESGICAFSSADTGYCTANCDPSQANNCPTGYVCGTIDDTPLCVLSAGGGSRGGGGCSVGKGTGTSHDQSDFALFAFVLLGLVWRRRVQGLKAS